MAMKNALASDSCPVTPTSSVRPIAAIAALMANSPVCSQNPSAYCGSHSSTPARTIQPSRLTTVSDTRQLPRSEQSRRPPQQDDEQHDVGDDVGQPAAQERDLVLVARRQRLRDADQQAPDERSGGGVETAENRHGYRAQRQQ